MRRVMWAFVLLVVAAVVARIAVGAHGEVFAVGVLALLLLCTGPKGFIAAVGVAGALVAPEASPTVASVAGADIHLTDLALAYALTGAAIRGRSAPPMNRTVKGLTIALVGWGVVRTNLDPHTVSFLRLLAPLTLAWALPRLVDTRRMWNIAALTAATIIVTAPFLTIATTAALNPGATRLAGLAGGPNQLGSIAGTLVLIGWLRSGVLRWALTAVGLLGLVYARSLSSLIAVAAGLIVAQVVSGKTLRRARPFAPFLVLIGAAAALWLGPQLRGDAGQSVEAHLKLASGIGRVIGQINVLLGAGWQNLPEGSTSVGTLHVLYLDWFAYLGAVGLALLLAWIVAMFRTSPDAVARAALVTTALWFVTTGAFPCPAWGLLALVLATCRSGDNAERQQLGPQVVEERQRGSQVGSRSRSR